MMDRPRRTTRNSLYASYNLQPSANATPPPTQSTSTSSSTTTSATPNPYKKPTYLANRPPPPPVEVTPTRGRGRSRGRASSRGNGPSSSQGARGRGSARPECVATRVESRRSTSGSNNSSKKKKRGAYNTNDYHYGSDFESDQNDSDAEPIEDASDDDEASELDEALESDSDVSLGSSAPKTPASRMPSPPVPLWMDSETTVEELDLPKSSDDLLLDQDLVMKAVAIYEPLRRFYQIVRLSPFTFEDFCAALGTEDTSILLNEIHIQLLKTIWREEETNGVQFGPLEVKDSMQAVLFFVDNLTWPECLRSYIESDPNWNEVHAEISSVEYPFCGPEVRISILSWMVDQFLATNAVREVMLTETIKHDDHCRYCGRLGQVIMCETCPAVYHLFCIEPPVKKDEEPPEDWQCPVCVKHNLPGITDCASELERAGLLIRHEKLGTDRHGRKYWFLVRRILVESDDGSSVWYYTTPLQVEELLYRLDEEKYEAELVENIRGCKEEIIRQMDVTEEITSEANKAHRRTYIEAENAFLKRIHEDRELAHERELEALASEEEKVREAKRLEEERKAREEEEVKIKEESEKKRIREERLHRRNLNKFVDYNPADWADDMKSSETSHGENDNHCDSVVGPADEDQAPDFFPEEPKVEVADNDTDHETMPRLQQMTDTQMAMADTQAMELDDVAPTMPLVEKSEGNDLISNGKIPNGGDASEPKADDKTTEDVLIKTEKTNTTPVLPKLEQEDPDEPVSSLPSQSKRKSKALLLDWDTEERMTRLKATGLYKLGQEGGYRTYVNYYNTDNLALGKAQLSEEGGKKRHMSHKFSLTPASDIKWANFTNTAGLRSNLVNCIRSTLMHLENTVPGTLMHVNWPLLKKAWIAALSACRTAKDFSKAMLMLSVCLRPAVYNAVWTESTAHHRFIRTTTLEREERKKAEKRDKKDRDDEEDRLRVLPPFVKYSIPPKHQVYKQKGEEYRIHGRWGWIWMSSSRRCKSQDCRKLGLLGGPQKHVIQVKNDTGKVKTILIDPTVFDKLMAKRSLSQKSTPTASPLKVPSHAKASKEKQTPSDSGGTLCDATVNKDESEKMDIEEDAKCKEEFHEAHSLEESMDTSSPEASKTEDSSASVDDAPVSQGETASKLPEEENQSTPEVEEKPVIDEESSFPTHEDSTTPAKVHNSSDVSRTKTASGIEEPTDEPKVKVEIKEEKDQVTSGYGSSIPSTPSAEDMKGRKFRTELINVSLGIVSANRILYPKIAHKSPVLDNLLSRRIQLQKLEEVELLETYGKEKLDKVQKILDNGGKIVDEPVPQEVDNTVEVLESNFPLGGIYRYKCYSYLCQQAALAFSQQKTNKIRDYECKCYSPMCRLKFFVQDTNRRKEEQLKVAEKSRLARLVEDVKDRTMFSKVESSAVIKLKKLPDEENSKRNPTKYPLTSTFRAISIKKPSMFILPQFELKKLGRTAGRVLTPSGYAVAPKAGSWAWPYPSGRPLFKTGWQYKTVHANTLAAIALHLRILWACVKWDDIQMKAPNLEGRNEITTDMDIITSEIFDHRVVGRFLERVQYLRKKTVTPIDAPKTIREITPSRSGLRKRKFAESHDRTEPLVTEEWVDEDRVELWEIRLYHEKKDNKCDIVTRARGDSLTPSIATRTKMGVVLKQPEKYDPSLEKEKADKEKAEKNVSAVKTAEIMREQMEAEVKMKRAVHLSKRDHHQKAPIIITKTPTPTASQQLQQQQAAAGLSAPPKSYGPSSSVGQKKVTVITKAITAGADAQLSLPSTSTNISPAVGILNRKNMPSSATPTTISTSKIGGVIQPQLISPAGTQKITLTRLHDGKLQVKGLLPGQTMVQSLDGRLRFTGGPLMRQTIVVQPGQNPVQVQTSSQPQPLINISNPAIRTVLNPSITNSAMRPAVLLPQHGFQVQTLPTSAQSHVGTTISLNQHQQPLIHTYAGANKTVRKVTPKLPSTPTAIAPATQGTTTQGQVVLTRTTPVIQGLNQQGQFVITSQPQGAGTIVLGGGTPVAVSVASPSIPSIVSGTTIVAQPTTPVQISQSQGTVITSQQEPHKVVIHDGNKTIVVSGSGTLTAQQLQQILQMQSAGIKKGAVTSTTASKQQIIQHVMTPSPTGQVGSQGHPIQIQTPQGTVQIIAGQQFLGSQSIQPHVGTTPGQTPILIQGGQLTTIGGQNVIVKNIMKSPTKPGTRPIEIAPSTGIPLPAAQLQQLINSGKVIKVLDSAGKPTFKVDTKTGIMNITGTSVIHQGQLTMSSSAAGASTVTKSSALPISIVSPAKSPPKLVTGMVPQLQTATISSVAGIKSPISSPGVPNARIITSSPAVQKPVMEAATVLSSLSTATPVISAPSTPIAHSAVSETPPGTPVGKSLLPTTPAKIAAQFVETPEGPRIVVSGFRIGDLTPSQVSSLNQQILKQLQEHPALKEKFKAMGDSASSVKIIVQQSPCNSPLSQHSLASSPMMEQVYGHKSTIISPSPAKIAKIESPVRTSPVKLSPGKTSPVKTPTKSQIRGQSPGASALGLISPDGSMFGSAATIAVKSPPNPANVDAAIAAVACDIDGPVCLNSIKSPKKSTISSPSISPYSLSLNSSSDKVVVQNEFLKIEAGKKAFEHSLPKKKAPRKSPAIATSLLESTVPLPMDQDVDICGANEDVVNEIEVSENNNGDVPRFVLSQDIDGRDLSGSMPYYSSQRSPSVPSDIDVLMSSLAPAAPTEKPKTGSSRRKSPVKVKQLHSSDTQIMSPPKKRISMSALASPKQLNLLSKQKELLRKDMSKKRILMERDLTLEVRKEIQEELNLHDEHELDTASKSVQKRKSLDKSPDDGTRKSGSVVKRAKKSSLSQKQFNCCSGGFDDLDATLCCGNCKLWYHETCIEVDEGRKQKFVCDDCLSKETEELFCFCRQPYNQTQFYIGCDTCDDWLHGHCVGLLPVEGEMPEYRCPKCDPKSKINSVNFKKLTEEDYAEISKTLKQIQQHKCAWPFSNPVDVKEAPNYYKIIKDPMDLQIVAQRVEGRMYNRLHNFIGDFVKILDNCRSFNPKKSSICEKAIVLEKFCLQKFSVLRSQLEKHK